MADRPITSNRPPPWVMHLSLQISQAAKERCDRYERTRSWRLTAPLRRTLRENLALLLPAFARRFIEPRFYGSTGLADKRSEVRAKAALELEAFIAAGRSLSLPADGDPEVSIVLVLWNQPEFTLLCLKSIAAEAEVRAEVILVDNGSDQQTADLLKLVSGARIISNAGNEGFPRAVNQGARIARGPSVLLLNNDATLRPGSLRAALRTLEADSRTGAVGGRLVFPDGTLQEAGCILWCDGSGHQYAHGSAVDRGCAMFRREADYCSGAFLLIRKTAFDEVGGLCEDYSPAYYEDTDLCLGLRKIGYRVIYEPEAVVDHYESASSGKRSRVQELIARNRPLFVRRNAEALRCRYAPIPEVDLSHLARTPAQFASNVLWICERVPVCPADEAQAASLARIVACHRAGCFVTVFPLSRCGDDWAAIYRDLPREIEVARDDDRETFLRFFGERAGLYDRIVPDGEQAASFIAELMAGDDLAAKLISAMADPDAGGADR